MGTVTITSSGFSALPASAPLHWPPNLTWPVGLAVNGTKSYTISDTDMLAMLSWIATTYNTTLVGASTPPVTVTAAQLLLAWLNGWMQAVTNAVQQQQTVPASPPPPISIA
jgi:hypothetical protein